jgi:hypothetical protein
LLQEVAQSSAQLAQAGSQSAASASANPTPAVSVTTTTGSLFADQPVWRLPVVSVSVSFTERKDSRNYAEAMAHALGTGRE